MTRVNVLIVVAIVASSLWLVRSAYEARRLYSELDRARGQQRVLELEHKRLEAERHAQATNLRVEKTARERLRMRSATPALTHYVVDPATAAAPEPQR